MPPKKPKKPKKNPLVPFASAEKRADEGPVNKVFDQKGKRYVTTTGRYGNQSSKRVVEKVITNIERTFPEAQRSDALNRFIDRLKEKASLTEIGADMAHVIPAEFLKLVVSVVLNNTLADPKDRKLAMEQDIELVEALKSSDDESGEIAKRIRKIYTATSPWEVIKNGKWVLKRLNGISRLLFPGDASTNRAIGYGLDIPKRKDGMDLDKVRKRIERLRKYADKHGLEFPDHVYGEDGNPLSSTSPLIEKWAGSVTIGSPLSGNGEKRKLATLDLLARSEADARSAKRVQENARKFNRKQEMMDLTQ